MDLTRLFRLAVHPNVTPILELTVLELDEDDAENPTDDDAALDAISGVSLILDYERGNGSASQRLVTCRRLSDRNGVGYLAAYCHHRKALRTFRLERIFGVFDPSSGEDFGNPQTYFSRFQMDVTANSGLSWGLSPSRRADLVALLTSLVFVARCDQDYHPLERDALESILATFWLRLELPGDPDIDDVLRYVDRLAPDGEGFWLSVQRLGARAELVPLLRSALRKVIEADGFEHINEFYWAQQIEAYLTE